MCLPAALPGIQKDTTRERLRSLLANAKSLESCLFTERVSLELVDLNEDVILREFAAGGACHDRPHTVQGSRENGGGPPTAAR